MMLDADDHRAIAAEVVKLLRASESQRLDAEFLASRPVEEVKKIQQEKMRRARAEQKGRAGNASTRQNSRG